MDTGPDERPLHLFGTSVHLEGTMAHAKDGRAMADVSVKELRANLRELVERAEAGEEIGILRRGRRVARLIPPEADVAEVPDLTEFRASIQIEGEPLSQTVIRQRRDARY